MPIDQNSTLDEAPITVSAIVPTTNSDGNNSSVTIKCDDSSPNNSISGSTSQQLTAQVAVVQTQNDADVGPHYITVSGK